MSTKLWIQIKHILKVEIHFWQSHCMVIKYLCWAFIDHLIFTKGNMVVQVRHRRFGYNLMGVIITVFNVKTMKVVFWFYINVNIYNIGSYNKQFTSQHWINSLILTFLSVVHVLVYKLLLSHGLEYYV